MARNEASVRFRAETSEFQASIKELNSAISTLRSEAKLNEAEFKSTGNAASYLENKQRILDSQLAATRGKQEALDAELRIAKTLFGEDSEQAAKLERQLNTVKAQEANLESALSACNSELKASKTETASLTDAIAKQESNLETLKSAYKEEVLAQREGSEEAQRLAARIKQENESLADNKAKLNAAERAVESLTGDTDELGRSTDDMARYAKLSDITLGDLAARGITALAEKAKDLAKQLVATGAGFEASMSKVSALSGATGDEYAALEAKAREMGAATTFSASEAADALGYMALAGWDTQSMMAGLPGVLSLAQAGEMDLAAASDLVTDYLSAFNMTAEDTGRMVDVLAFAQANANTNTEQLGAAFKNCAANCNAAGMDVETTSAAISMMSNQGLKGSEAGTALNAVMRDMTAKMEDGAIKIGETSIAVMDAEGNYRSFADILADVEAVTNGMGDAEKVSALQATFTADSIKGLNLMLNAGSGELSSFRDRLYDCNGAAQATADTMTDNLGGDVSEMQSAFEELQLKIYEGLEEPLRSAVGFITNDLIGTFNEMDASTAAAIATFVVATTAGIGLQKAFVSISQAGGLAKQAMNLLARSSVLLEGGLAGLIAGGLALEAVALYDCYQKTQKLEKGTNGLVSAAKSASAAMGDGKADISGFASETENAKADVDGLVDSLCEMSDAMNERHSQAATEVATLGAYGDVVQELAGKAGLSAEEEAKLQLAVEKVNEACGTSYTLSGSTAEGYQVMADGAAVAKDEIARLIDTQKAQIQMDALHSDYSDILGQQEEAAKTLAAAEKELAAAKEDLAAKSEYLSGDALANEVGAYDAAKAKYDAAKGSVVALAEAESNVAAQMGLQQSVIDGTANAYSEFIASSSSLRAGVDEAGQSLESFQGHLQQTGFSVEDLSTLSEEELTRMGLAYDGTVGSIKASLYTLATDSSTYGQQAGQWLNEGFSPGAQEVINSATSMTGMTTAQFMLLAQSAGAQGEEAVTALANALIAGSGQGGDAAAQMMAAVALSMTGGDVAAASKIAGDDAVQGLVNGLTEGQGLPAEAAGQMGTELLNRVRATLGIASPSTEMITIGGYLNEGLAQGISESTAGPESAMEQVGQRLAMSLQTGLQTAQNNVAAAADSLSKLAADHMSSASLDAWFAGANMASESFSSGVASGQPNAAAAADSLSKLTADHMSSANADAWWAGHNMSEGMANGIRDGASLAVNAARDMARDAVEAAKREAEINSPSKTMAREVGVWYPEGMAMGIEQAISVSDQAAEEMSRSAVAASFDGLRSGMEDMTPLFAVPGPEVLAAYAPAASSPVIEVAVNSGLGATSHSLSGIESRLGSVVDAIEALDSGLGQTIRNNIPGTGIRDLRSMFS